VEETIRVHPASSQRFIREHLEENVRTETIAAALEHLAGTGRIVNLGTAKKQEWRIADG
jgi:predicted urease superfamily metal-dependent hydrolase